MAVIRQFNVRSSAHPSVWYTVSIHDALSERHHGAQAVGAVIMCESATIATVLGWLTPEGNIALPDLNPVDLGTINMDALKTA